MAAAFLSGWISLLRRKARKSSVGGDGAATPGPLPVQRREFLNTAERAFLSTLRSVVATRVLVCPKLRLSDLLKVTDPGIDPGLSDRLRTAHVDFILCDPATLHVLCAIELDDITPSSPARRYEEVFVGAAFLGARIRVLRFPAKSQYSPYEIAERLNDVLFLPDDLQRFKV